MSVETKIVVIEKKNLIYFNAPIDNVYTLELIDILNDLEQKELERVDKIMSTIKRKSNILLKEEDYIQPILLEINSDGGVIHDAFAVVDTIRQLKIPVHTICKGITSSAATLISVAGHRRFITKHSYFLIHELKNEITGSFTGIKQSFQNSKYLMNHLIEYYKENSKLSREEIIKYLKNENCWNAEKTLEYGFVDEIL